MGPTITMWPDEEKAGLATGELQKAFPPHLPPETEVDRTPRGSLLACMTASREPSNQSFEVDREATVRYASRRFFFRIPDFDQICLSRCSRSSCTINSCCAFASDEPEPPRPVF